MDSKSIDTFRERVNANKSWQFFNIIAAIGRGCPTEHWKILLLFVRLEQEGSTKAQGIFENDFFKIVDETRNIASFHSFLSEIFGGNTVELVSTTFSLDLVKFPPSLISDTGMPLRINGNDHRGDSLIVKGGSSTEYGLVKEKCGLSLKRGDPPYENIDDVISDKTKISPTYLVDNVGPINESRTLMMIYAPKSIRLEPPSVVNDQMTIGI